jgi:hypothetical protein
VISKTRQLHLYLGIFFAPSIIFFAFSGALQTFGLHESRPGSSYEPPAWIAKMSQIHKDQRLEGLKKRIPHPIDKPAFHPEEKSAQPIRFASLKWFVLIMSIGLITTTMLGIYMSFAYHRNRLMLWGLLFGGILFPIILLGL